MFLKGANIVLLDNVAMVTLLYGIWLAIMCLQTAEHVPCLVVVRDHGLVPEAVVVDKPVGLHSGVEDQVRAEDVDVLAGEEHDRVNSDLSAEEEVFFIAASLNTPGMDRGYVDKTVAIPINTPGIDRGYVDQTVAIPINTCGIDRGYVDQIVAIPNTIFFVDGSLHFRSNIR